MCVCETVMFRIHPNLTQLDQNKMSAILQTTFEMHFLEWTIRILIKISMKFVPNGKIDNESAIGPIRLGAEHATSHYLKQWWSCSRKHIHHSALMSERVYGHIPKSMHDDVIKWKHFLRYWPSVRGIHRSPVDSPPKGQWRGALMFSLTCAWTNG